MLGLQLFICMICAFMFPCILLYGPLCYNVCLKQEIRSMEHVSAQCILFPTPLSKQEFAMYGVILL